MIRIEPRTGTSRAFTFGIPVLSAVISLALAAIPLMLAGANPIAAYGEMVKGIFGSVFALSEMLTRATPLIFTGLAAALAFRRQALEYRGRGAALPRRHGGGVGRVRDAGLAGCFSDAADHPARRGGWRGRNGGADLSEDPVRRRRGCDHAASEFRHPDLSADDAGRPAEGPHGPWLAAIGADPGSGHVATPDGPDAGAFRADHRACGCGHRAVHAGALGLGVPAARRRRKRRGRAACRHQGQPVALWRRDHLRRAGRAGGGQRGGRPEGLSDRGSVAGLRLYRHCRGHARGAFARWAW